MRSLSDGTGNETTLDHDGIASVWLPIDEDREDRLGAAARVFELGDRGGVGSGRRACLGSDRESGCPAPVIRVDACAK